MNTHFHAHTKANTQKNKIKQKMGCDGEMDPQMRELTGYSHKRPVFGSWNLHGSSLLSSFRGSDSLRWPQWAPNRHRVYIHTSRETLIYIT